MALEILAPGNELDGRDDQYFAGMIAREQNGRLAQFGELQHERERDFQRERERERKRKRESESEIGNENESDSDSETRSEG